MKRRLSPWFFGITIPGLILAAALWFGVLPEIEQAVDAPVRGEIVFPEEAKHQTTGAHGNIGGIVSITAWFSESFDDLIHWKHNPWRKNGGRPFPGGNYQLMLASDDPMEKARAREIQRLAEAWLRRLMDRYPELSVEPKSVPDDRNAFLRWLEFSERVQSVKLPQALQDILSEKEEWNPDVAREWLAANATLMDQLHAMGKMTEASVNGIPVERYAFLSALLPKQCSDFLIMEARLAAENGDTAKAMDSVRATQGLADLLVNTESPGFLQATVNILICLDLEKRIFSQILPALPPGSRDPEAWQALLNTRAHSHAEFARLIKGEWSVMMRQWVLPPALDHTDPLPIPDAGAMLDAYTRPFAERVKAFENAKFGEEPQLSFDPQSNVAGLSKYSKELVGNLLIDPSTWSKGVIRAQHSHALTAAAFAIMKGDPVPQDPMRGLPYRWDATTRTLSLPAGDEFDAMNIAPIVVPER